MVLLEGRECSGGGEIVFVLVEAEGGYRFVFVLVEAEGGYRFVFVLVEAEGGYRLSQRTQSCCNRECCLSSPPGGTACLYNILETHAHRKLSQALDA